MKITQSGFRFDAALVAAIGCAGGMVTLVAFLSPTEAQTAASPSPKPHVILRSRDLPPSGGGPFVSQSNYSSTALTLRHWRQPEVTFHVTPSQNDKRTPEQVRALVAQGLALWKDRVGKKLTLQMTDSADAANVEINFVPVGTLTGGRVGETNISFADPENDIQRGTIQLVEGLSAEELVQAVAHESGHALGIQGHSDDKHDLMYPYAHLPAEITDRDVTTFNIAYYQIDTSKKTRVFKRDQKFATAKSY